MNLRFQCGLSFLNYQHPLFGKVGYLRGPTQEAKYAICDSSEIVELKPATSHFMKEKEEIVKFHSQNANPMNRRC